MDQEEDDEFVQTKRSSVTSVTRQSKRITSAMLSGISALRNASKQTTTTLLTRNPAVAAKDTSQLTIKLFASTKCHTCKRQFNAEVGKRRYCRRCGEIFCFECCSARVRLKVYHSRIGVLKNNTSKAQLVCGPCLAEVLGEEEEDHAGEEEEEGKVHVPHHGAPPPLPPRPNTHQLRRLSLTGATTRKPTLEKYVNAVKRGGVNLDHGFKFRLQAKHQHKPTQVERSLTRAKTLRDGFFDGVNIDEFQSPPPPPQPATTFVVAVEVTPPRIPAIKLMSQQPEDSTMKKIDSFADMKQAAQAATAAAAAASTPKSANTWGDYFSSLLVRSPSPPPPPAFNDDNDNQEISLEDMLQTETQQFRKLVQAKDEIEHRGRLARIKQMLGKLTEVQDTKIAEFQRQTSLLDKQLRAHAKGLEAMINAKRYYGEDEFRNVVDLREELRNIVLHLDNLQLENVFPACLRWKLKAKIEDGMFAGVRDLDIARFDADFTIEVKDQSLVFSMSNIRLDIALYGFEIRGDTAKAKVLRSALASTLNQVELSMSGEWVLPLMFEEGGGSTAHSRWVADKDKSSFTVRLAKQGGKKSAFQLPDSFLQWFASSLVPNLIETQILATLPTKELGGFLCKSNNHVAVSGRFQILGDTTPQIWKAPLVGPNLPSEQARGILGFANEDEAFIFDFILASELAQCAGFDSKTGTMSLFQLYTWRLRFAAHSLASLAPLLAIVEHGSKMNVPQNWLLQFLRRVDEVAAKPMTVEVHLFQVNLDLDMKELLTVVTSIYLGHVEENVAKEVEMENARFERKKRSQSVTQYVHNKKNPQEVFRLAKEAVDAIHANFDLVLVPLVRDELHTQFNAMIAGGSGGMFAFSFTDVLANVCLPSKFMFQALLFEAVELYQGFVLKVNGQHGKEEGEYAFKLNVLPVGEEEEEDEGDDKANENDVETSFKHVKLDFFMPGKPPGTMHVSMDSWKSTVLITSLIKFIVSYTSTAAASSPQAQSSGLLLQKGSFDGGDHRSSLRGSTASAAAQTEGAKELMIQSRRVVENLWNSFRAFQQEMDPDVALVQAGIAGVNPLLDAASAMRSNNNNLNEEDDNYNQRVYLPYLTNDLYALHIDVRGLKLAMKKSWTRVHEELKEGIRLTLVKKESQLQTLVSFSIRVNLQDVFQSDMLPV